MFGEQDRAPLYEALLAYTNRRPTIFHVPGHKQGRGAPPVLRALLQEHGLALDLTEAMGLDDLHAPEGCIAQAQGLAAAAFGAGQTYFLVGGTTAGLQALIMAACRPGDTLLVPRHAHQSMIGGLILSGAVPHYIRPQYDSELDLPLGITPEALAEALAHRQDARAVSLVHPTYHGVPAQLSGLIEQAHDRGLPVLVDEAHGAHFAFHPALPSPALTQGADGVAQSLHKTGGSLTQSSLLHLAVQTRLVPHRVRSILRLIQTSSPSYLLMVSLDLARRQLALYGEEQWERALETAAYARCRLGAVVREWAFADPTRLVIDVRRWQVSGPSAAAQLWQQGIAVELAGPSYVLALVSPSDGKAEVDRLIQALYGLQADGSAVSGSLGEPPWPSVAMPPRTAFLAEHELVPFEQAGGRVAGEFIAPYPPGIPALAPGEYVTGDVIEYLRNCMMRGIHLQGPADPDLRMILVVRE